MKRLDISALTHEGMDILRLSSEKPLNLKDEKTYWVLSYSQEQLQWSLHGLLNSGIEDLRFPVGRCGKSGRRHFLKESQHSHRPSTTIHMHDDSPLLLRIRQSLRNIDA